MIPLTLDHYRRKRIKRKLKRLAVTASGGLLMLFGFTLGLSSLSYLEQLTVEEVNFSGQYLLPESEALELIEEITGSRHWGILSKRNSLIWPRQEVKESLLETYPRLKTATIKRTSLQTIDINFTQRQASLLWCELPESDAELTTKPELPEIELSGTSTPEELIKSDTALDELIEKQPNHCFFSDDEGFIFTSAPVFSTSIFFRYYHDQPLEIGQKPLPLEVFGAVEDFHRAVPSLRLTPDATEIDSQYFDFKLYLKEGGYLHFSLEEPLELTLDRLQRFLWEKEDELIVDGRLEVDYIDLRFGNRIFYRPTDSPRTLTE